MAYLDNSWRSSHHSTKNVLKSPARSKANATQMAEKAEKKASEAEQDHGGTDGSVKSWVIGLV